MIEDVSDVEIIVTSLLAYGLMPMLHGRMKEMSNKFEVVQVVRGWRRLSVAGTQGGCACSPT